MKKDFLKGALLFALSFSLLSAFSACRVSSSSEESSADVFSTFYGSFAPEESDVSSDGEVSSSEISSVTDSPDYESSSSETSSVSKEDEPPTLPEPISHTKYIRCTGENVRIRSGAGTEYEILGTAEKGTIYALLGQTGNWYKTYYRNRIAYLSVSYATTFALENGNEAVENVLRECYKLIGVPYVYGAIRLHDGTGKLLSGFMAQKFDCSSLVQYAFYKGANIVLQVNTRTQFRQGEKVFAADLQRGDCLYFTNEERQYNTGIERVGHVAVYLGDSYILHTASDYARIEKMSAARWNFFLEGRRFFA